jgi:hypothetical protein
MASNASCFSIATPSATNGALTVTPMDGPYQISTRVIAPAIFPQARLQLA